MSGFIVCLASLRPTEQTQRELASSDSGRGVQCSGGKAGRVRPESNFPARARAEQYEHLARIKPMGDLGARSAKREQRKCQLCEAGLLPC